MDWYDPTCYAVEILDAKYEKVEVDEVITHLTHLNFQQKEDLKQVLQGILSSLMVPWVFIPTENSILT